MTNAELAVLSLVAEQPRHGYQIEQIIEERGMRRWTEVGFSSIYFLLKKLEHGGFIEGRLQKTERGPARKVYHATKTGQEAFHAAIIEVLSVPQPSPRPLMLGLANLPSLSSKEALTALSQYSEHLEEKMGILRAVLESNLHPHPYFVDAMFELGLMVMQAELEWVEKFTKQIQEQSQTKQE
jgi:DNA-binding PadR family transcriptional regulator